MLKIRQEHYDSFRPLAQTTCADRVFASLQKQGVQASRYDDRREINLPDNRGLITTLSFLSNGLPSHVTMPSGTRTEFIHDQSGSIIAIIRPDGERIDILQDSRGNVSSLSCPGELKHRFHHDSQNRLTLVEHPDETTTHLKYHAAGPLESITDRTGATTHYRRTPDGQLCAIVDALGRETAFILSDEGSLSGIQFPDGSRQDFFNDPEQHAATAILRDGKRVRYCYDGSAIPSLIKSIIWSEECYLRIEYSSQGYINRLQNHYGSLEFAIDKDGNTTQEQSGSDVVLFDYDADGRLIKLCANRGDNDRGVALYHYDYDEDGRLCGICAWNQFETTINYTPSERVITVQYGNGLVETQHHDRTGHLARVTVSDAEGWIVSEQLYQYDLAERLVSVTDVWGASPGQRLTRKLFYDAEGRLLAEFDVDADTLVGEYGYDAKGNLIYDNGTRIHVGLRDEPLDFGAVLLDYTPNGQLRRFQSPMGEVICEYRADGLLREVCVDGRVIQFTYDALGRRTLKNDGSTVWRYGWAGHQMIWEERQAFGEATPSRRDYLFFPDGVMPFAYRENGRTYWLQSDSRGAAIRVFNEQGEVVWRATYDSFGGLKAIEGEVYQPWRLAGQYADEETGLYYTLARYYSPSLKSFLSCDPNWMHYGATNYSYACNDPWNRADPSGALPFLLVIGIGALIGGVVRAGIAYFNHGDVLSSFLGGAVEGAFWAAGGAIAGGIKVGGFILTTVVRTSIMVPFAQTGGFWGSIAEQATDQVDGICLPCAIAQGESSGRWAVVFGAFGGLLRYIGSRPVTQSILQSAGSALQKLSYGIRGFFQGPATKAEIEALRRASVKEAWKQEKALLEQTGRGTRPWTLNEQKQLLENGKVLKYNGHHINSVGKYPNMAGEPNNIKFLTRPEHLLEHGGKWTNPTSGPFLNRSGPYTIDIFGFPIPPAVGGATGSDLASPPEE